MPTTSPFWLSVFLDCAADDYDLGAAFWCDVTGFSVSSTRGDSGEFATLLPLDGDDYLRVQRLGSGSSRVHLDVHVPDARAAADRAIGFGATEVAAPGHIVMTSPSGLPFCLVAHPAAERAAAVEWPGGHLSRLYQVSIDVPRAAYDAEAGFWAGVLHADPELLVRRPEFSWLRPPGRWALDVLLQRLDREDGPASAHLDLGTTDRVAETARHVALGARVLVVEEFWTVLRDPVGMVYCVTDRDPRTGRLDG